MASPRPQPAPDRVTWIEPLLRPIAEATALRLRRRHAGTSVEILRKPAALDVTIRT